MPFHQGFAQQLKVKGQDHELNMTLSMPELFHLVTQECKAIKKVYVYMMVVQL